MATMVLPPDVVVYHGIYYVSTTQYHIIPWYTVVNTSITWYNTWCPSVYHGNIIRSTMVPDGYHSITTRYYSLPWYVPDTCSTTMVTGMTTVVLLWYNM